jgi:SAM-dependent methyltransferase
MSDVYPLGDSTDESARLRSQSEQLRPISVELLDRVGLKPGQSAIDLGCGPSGVLELMSEAVGPDGRVVGLDANPQLVALAAAQAPGNVEVLVGDARRTGLDPDSFDVVHARTLLANLPDPAAAVAEMVRLAVPGGWVAGHEPDVECSVLYPALPEWDRMRELFRAAFDGLGADLLIGRRLTELYRDAGLEEIGVHVHAVPYPAGHARRTILPDLVRSLRPVILRAGLAVEPELVRIDAAVREHLADPRTFVMSELMVVAWGRKPATLHSEERSS